MSERIVVTGLGAHSPLGESAVETWRQLLAGVSGARTLDYEWVERYNLSVRFAAQARVRPDTILERPVAKRLDPSSQFALLAARAAWEDAGRPDVSDTRLGVDWATGIGGLWSLLDAWDVLREKGERRVMPLTVPMLMPNAPAAAVSMHLGARAFARTVASACASSTESIIAAMNHIRAGLADVVIAGGSESAIHPITLASFNSMQALSRRNDCPETASRPYSFDRDGFVMAEGGAALVLEREGHARARGARIYAEVAGGGVTADSHHITAPEPEGLGAARAVELALEQAGACPADVTHINAHATSTPTGDIAEFRALEKVFGSERVREIPVAATKGATGHLLGGTGALEALFTVLAVSELTVPPTINMTEQDPAIPLRVFAEASPLSEGSHLALSNSFGFGGHNAVLAVRSV